MTSMAKTATKAAALRAAAPDEAIAALDMDAAGLQLAIAERKRGVTER